MLISAGNFWGFGKICIDPEQQAVRPAHHHS